MKNLNKKQKLTRDHGPLMGKAYGCWVDMRRRKLRSHEKKNACYANVNVTERWQKFDNFLSDMGLPPSLIHSIDRVDSKGDYTPKNCRWADRQTQSRNRPGFVKLDFARSSHIRDIYKTGVSQQEIANEFGCSQGLISQVIRYKLWRIEDEQSAQD